MVGRGPDGWVTNGVKITDPELLHRIQEVLVSGPIFVRFALLRGGGAPNWEVFTSYEQFLIHLSGAKPGDWYTIWSFSDMIGRNARFLRKRYEALDPSSTEFQQDLAILKNFLEWKDEALVIALGPGLNEANVVFVGLDGYEEIVRLGDRFERKPVEFFGFYWEDIERHPFIDAKVPNAAGEVPSGGVY